MHCEVCPPSTPRTPEGGSGHPVPGLGLPPPWTHWYPLLLSSYSGSGWKVHDLQKAGGGGGPPSRPWTVMALSTFASSFPQHTAEVRLVLSILSGPSGGGQTGPVGTWRARAPPTGRGLQCPPAGRSRDGFRTRIEVPA